MKEVQGRTDGPEYGPAHPISRHFLYFFLSFFFLVFFPCNSFARSRIIFFQIVAAHTGIPVYLFNPHDKHAHFLIFRGFVSKNIFTERI